MCKSILDKTPFMLVILSLCWSYYAYVILYCFYVLTVSAKQIIYAVLFHSLFVMLLWTFVQTVLCTHKEVPEEYRLSLEEHNRLMAYKEEEANTILAKLIALRTLDIFNISTNNHIRYCKICRLIKPDRVHHCSTCNRCILKMDHHCPWVYNCIGFSNYKKFILLLFYTAGWCCFTFGTLFEESVESLYEMRQNTTKLQIGLGCIMSALVGTFILILFVYHISLLLKNETTLESLRDVNFTDGNKTYNVGCWNNFMQIFGENCCLWWFPVQSSLGSGLEFPTRNLIRGM